MEWFSDQHVSIIWQLLPGFLAAWVFHANTAHRGDSAFERVVEALIFTTVVRSLTILLRELFFLMGHLVALGSWSDDAALVASLAIAVLIGIVAARMANAGTLPHWVLRLAGSKRTAFPSEWYSAFHRNRRWVVLHLVGERRLYGWPEEWPDQPDRGHFIIDLPEWLLDTGQRVPLYNVHRIIVSVQDVTMVEMVRENREVIADPDDIVHARTILENLNKKGPC